VMIYEEYYSVVFPSGIGEPEDQQIHKPDMHFLVDLLHTVKPVNILEIGACQGTSSRTFGKYLKDTNGGVVLSVEPQPTDVYWEQRELRGLVSHMSLLDDCSPCRDRVGEAMKQLGIPHFDLIFVDGLHRFVNVIMDFCDHLDLVRKGGWAAFHDTKHMPEVKDAVAKLEKLKFIKRHSDSESSAGLTAYQVLDDRRGGL
jgi:predicted O-methyltransferase YrrM